MAIRIVLRFRFFGDVLARRTGSGSSWRDRRTAGRLDGLIDAVWRKPGGPGRWLGGVGPAAGGMEPASRRIGRT